MLLILFSFLNMQRLFLRCALLIVLMMSAACTSLPAGSRLPAAFARAAQEAGVPPDAIAIQIESVGASAPLLAHHAGAAMQPASLMKLVTTAAALDLLGPGYRWNTRIYTNGTQSGAILQGDLIIKGSGDPRLSQRDLWSVLRSLRAQGIQHISGDLLLDRSLFEFNTDDAMQFDGKPERAYNALPDALLLDTKTLTLRFVPDEKNQIVQVRTEPYLAGLQVTAPKLVSGECGAWRKSIELVFAPQALRFDGSYALACGEQHFPIHAYNYTHLEYFDASLRQIWSELGGTIAGSTREVTFKEEAHVAGHETTHEIAAWQSAPLSDVIRDINKYSNNVMARQLLLTLSAEGGVKPATKISGVATIQDWLLARGIKTAGLVIENGSGLSRDERISAADLARVLQLMWHSPTMPEFISSLPLAGVDGTMRKRVQNMDVKAYAHIKTGSLADVAGIAGYVTARSGKRLIIVCMINHPNADKLRGAMDTLLQWVYEHN